MLNVMRILNFLKFILLFSLSLIHRFSVVYISDLNSKVKLHFLSVRLCQILISGHQTLLKLPGDCPVFFLKAVYIADRDLNPESIPTPSIEKWSFFLSFNIFRALSTR